MRIDEVAVYRYRLRLRRPVRLKTEMLTHRSGLLLRLTWIPASAGMTGSVAWGEAAPLPGFSTESKAEATESLLHFAWLLRRNDLSAVRVAFPSAPASVAFAVESALEQLRAQTRGLPLSE